MQNKVASPFVGVVVASTFFASPARAALTYYLYESSGNLILETLGSLNLPSPAGSDRCNINGAIAPQLAVLCTGPGLQLSPYYGFSGPRSIGTGNVIAPATSFTGIATAVAGFDGYIVIDSSYVSGTPIISSATFAGQTIANLGLTSTTDVLGSWILADTGDTVTLRLGPPPAPVPGPLSVLGLGAAFGLSRRLRKRIHSRQASGQS